MTSQPDTQSIAPTLWHPLQPTFSLPPMLNCPFCYEPHPLVQLAARQLQAQLPEPGEGKMFGVLVVENADGELGYLAAYSGQTEGLDERQFVPPVFDYLQPDGHFKRHETEITALNHRIEALENASEHLAVQAELQAKTRDFIAEENQWRSVMAVSKQQRDSRRASGQLTSEEAAALIKESQFQKAELHRMKKQHRATLGALTAQVEETRAEVERMKAERKRLSDALQRWLFDEFRVADSHGTLRPLSDIFRETIGRMPPSGAGECCEPKLLHYAFTHGLRPRVIGMFWWGESPEGEVRHHKRFYPACQGKCRPLLTWMLRDVEVQPNPLEQITMKPLKIVYEDNDIAIVDKPDGLLTIPGRCNMPSVFSVLHRQWPTLDSPLIVHRLDMDTSGLLVVGKTREAHRALSLQFENRETEKAYVALLEHALPMKSGKIDLPLLRNPDDSPRQMVNYQDGKPSLTIFEVVGTTDGHPRVMLYPKTGRTHQLRMHCAHREGLNNPIVGDRLYGSPARRLCLHAMRLTITHPTTGQRMTFESQPDF